MPQEETTRLLVEHARAGPRRRAAEGRRPVRLRPRRRGGAGAARARASRSRSCPGITAGIAAPAYAGIPVTQRGVASAVAFVTGHEDPDKPETRSTGRRSPRFPGTLVFYMGVAPAGRDRRAADRRRPRRATSRRPSSSAARCPASASCARRWRVRASAPPRRGSGAPAITVVGAGRRARRRARLARRAAAAPGARSPSRARARRPARSRARLRALGAARRRGAGDPRSSRWTATSPDLARYDLRLPHEPQRRRAAARRRASRDARALAGAAIAAIGPGTAAALREHGIERRRRPRALGRRVARRRAGATCPSAAR